jgi:hypothetical protein
MELIRNLNLVERVWSWTTTLASFTYKTKGTTPFSKKISTSLESTIVISMERLKLKKILTRFENKHA